jgi:hypothetical protein
LPQKEWEQMGLDTHTLHETSGDHTSLKKMEQMEQYHAEGSSEWGGYYNTSTQILETGRWGTQVECSGDDLPL